MSLTGTALQVLTIAVAGVAVTATVVFWAWLGRSAWYAVAARLGVILLVQVSILLAVAVSANRYFGFYGTWGDLLGRSQDIQIIDKYPASASASPAHAVRATGDIPLPAAFDKEGMGRGRLQHVQIKGRDSGITGKGIIYLPPEYATEPARKFPVTVVLTGYPGTAINLVRRLEVPTASARLVKAGRIKPTVLVLMRPTLTPPRDTECIDIPGGPKIETFFARDLPRALSGAYRVQDDPRHRGIMGTSTGGYCSLKLAMRNPQVYSAAAALGGYYKAAQDSTTGDLFGGDPRLAEQNNLFWLLKQHAAPQISALVTSARRGEKNYQETLRFLDAVKPPMKISSLILNEGGHNYRTWTTQLPAVLTWMNTRLTP